MQFGTEWTMQCKTKCNTNKQKFSENKNAGKGEKLSEGKKIYKNKKITDNFVVNKKNTFTTKISEQLIIATNTAGGVINKVPQINSYLKFKKLII